MVDRNKLEEEIRQVAFEIYVSSGCIPGRDFDNWLQAERIVLEKYGLIEKEEAQSESEVSKVKKTSKRACKSKTSSKTSSSKKGKTAKKTKK